MMKKTKSDKRKRKRNKPVKPKPKPVTKDTSVDAEDEMQRAALQSQDDSPAVEGTNTDAAGEQPSKEEDVPF
jgi:hypothetical protein